MQANHHLPSISHLVLANTRGVLPVLAAVPAHIELSVLALKGAVSCSLASPNTWKIHLRLSVYKNGRWSKVFSLRVRTAPRGRRCGPRCHEAHYARSWQLHVACLHVAIVDLGFVHGDGADHGDGEDGDDEGLGELHFDGLELEVGNWRLEIGNWFEKGVE